MRCFGFALTAVILGALVSFSMVVPQDDEALTNERVLQLLDAQMSTRVIIKTIESAKIIRFDTSPAALIALKKAGANDELIELFLEVARARGGGSSISPTLRAPEKSEVLRDSRNPSETLRNLKTMFVNASNAQFFGSPQMKAALGDYAGFRALGISIVEDRAVADAVLEVNYTFAWDYPFVLKHQNTSVVLLSGKGSGAFSGPAGASSVAREFVRLLKPYRLAPAPKKEH
jgi:hypothetical protein